MGFLKRIVGRFSSNGEACTGPKPGRNEPCWCGSGMKYKKCHLEEDTKKERRFFSPSCGPS
ncbi:MAG: SEC-C metal-binding domain-containing protein [Nitrospirota bacterium]|jgi:hypothetical protein